METKSRISIAPLAVLRIAYGLVLFISTIRFLTKGWVYDFYITPKLFFPFYGFEWVRPLPSMGMYLIFIGMALASLFIMVGFLYRLSVTTFFICFVYTELIDKTYYLNHYYFVSVITFLFLLVPANRYFSVDVFLKPSLKITKVPAWMINIFKAQLCLVYFFAGLSKLNHDWMLEAMPLKLWLPANGDLPLIGPILKQTWVAFLFSWFGAVFDLSIGFLLLFKPTRTIAYVFVLIFHVFTGWLFKIGMFPFIMISVTIVFFSPSVHLKIIGFIRRLLRKLSQNFFRTGSDTLMRKRLPSISESPPRALVGRRSPMAVLRMADGHFLDEAEPPVALVVSRTREKWIYAVLIGWFAIQLILPFRYLFYPGKLYWTEEGYRFSWRVMLMEKGGTAFFYIKDPKIGRRWEVVNGQFLTPLQERMMQTQPDMILQYAHYLHDYYHNKGIPDPVVTVESYVTLNGSGSRLFIDSTIDLSKQHESFLPKKWVMPFQ